MNKYDLSAQGNIVKNGFLSYIDFNRFRYISFEKTIAIEGKGVSDTFIKLIKFFFPQLKINLSISN